MTETYVAKVEREAAEELAKVLARPTAPSQDYIGVYDKTTNQPEYFNPWDLFPLYGHYSSEFDDMALHVLQNLLDQSFEDESLPHQMFREMLCKMDLCEYGTSPRVCFPTNRFRELLPQLIAKWKEYYKLQWED